MSNLVHIDLVGLSGAELKFPERFRVLIMDFGFAVGELSSEYADIRRPIADCLKISNQRTTQIAVLLREATFFPLIPTLDKCAVDSQEWRPLVLTGEWLHGSASTSFVDDHLASN